MGSAGVPPDIVAGIEHRPSEQHIERETLCFSQPTPGIVLEKGREGFVEELARFSSSAESNAAERLVQLKRKLQHTHTDDFWSIATEGLAELTDAQYAFVSKRILVDDENSNVEMPPIGTPGSCLMAAAFYYSNDADVKGVMPNIRYAAWDCPCAYMKHDKVFLIHDRLSEFVPESQNPNAKNLIVPGESYLGIPLFHEGKCFAHFGVMWSLSGAKRRELSWPFLEMMFHTLEDLFVERLLQGTHLRGMLSQSAPKPVRQAEVIPHESVSAAQSLKPYARSLSHELRTPMQGVVGMLDVMHATVQEAAEGLSDPRLRKVFQTLKQNIEVVQDSSRRAVEAADNIVHAYDMNMGVPDTPLSPMDEEQSYPLPGQPSQKQTRPFVVTGSNINFCSRKRRHEETQEPASPTKKRAIESLQREAERTTPPTDSSGDADLHDASLLYTTQHMVAPGLRHTDLRDVLQYVVNDSLKVGGRPESAIARETDLGEHIEVRHTDSSGCDKIKIIEWSVDPGVPETMFIDEKDLAKMISCVFLNAVKFTEQGRIIATARVSPKARYVVINIKDTGPGIPEAFLPNLFKPFSREDDSLTRQSEGLGLGLLVAKGLARKLGGDLYCIRAETKGPNKGCEFEMRVPLTPGDICSRPGSPFSSPSPSVKSRRSLELDSAPFDTSPRSKPQSHPMSDGLKEILARRLAQAQSSALSQPIQLATPTPTPLTGNPLASPNLLAPPPLRPGSPQRRKSSYGLRRHVKREDFDRSLAEKYPLKFLVAEDNKINRKLLVNMLQKLGYRSIQEAYDGADAVRQMEQNKQNNEKIDVILMDLWMPFMDGYEASERILQMDEDSDAEMIGGVQKSKKPTILAVTADVTDGALERAAKVGMKGFMTKPYKLLDLERLIMEYCAGRDAEYRHFEGVRR